MEAARTREFSDKARSGNLIRSTRAVSVFNVRRRVVLSSRLIRWSAVMSPRTGDCLHDPFTIGAKARPVGEHENHRFSATVGDPEAIVAWLTGVSPRLLRAVDPGG